MAFPTTSVLDSFTRANEGPPPSASWSTDILAEGSTSLLVSSNALTTSSLGTGWWNPQTFGPDSEGYFTAATRGTSQIRGYLRLATPGVATADGYMFYNNGAPGSQARIFRMDDGVFSQLGADGSATLSDGDSFGWQAVGTSIASYQKVGGVWSSIITRTDSTYSNTGYIGLAVFSSSQAFTNFGGGTFVPIDFPTTGILDDFNRANEGPPPSANWTGSVGLSLGNTLKVLSSQMGENTGDGGAYWNPSTFGPDCEVYTTCAVVASANYYLLARIANPGAGTTDGYLAFWGSDELFLYRVDNDVATQLGVQNALVLSAGDKFGCSVVGSLVTAYAYTGGSWSSLTTRTDAAYSAAGYVGAGTFSGSSRFDGFGGGTVVVEGSVLMLVMGMLGTGRV